MAAGSHRRRTDRALARPSRPADVRGNATRARIVLFRKPIERRAKDTEELAELLHKIPGPVAIYLDVDPSVIDPTIDD